jgi:hypothetical protein
MFRIALPVGLVLALSATLSAAPPLITVGEKYEGEIKGDKKYFSNHFPAGTTWAKNPAGGKPIMSYGYASTVTVKLEAKQKVTLTATVEGAKRNVEIFVIDPSKTLIGATSLDEDSTSLTIERLAVTGTFTVVVYSQQVGEFNLKITTSDKPTAAELKEKIVRLKKELAEAEAALKALEEKEKK